MKTLFLFCLIFSFTFSSLGHAQEQDDSELAAQRAFIKEAKKTHNEAYRQMDPEGFAQKQKEEFDKNVDSLALMRRILTKFEVRRYLEDKQHENKQMLKSIEESRKEDWEDLKSAFGVRSLVGPLFYERIEKEGLNQINELGKGCHLDYINHLGFSLDPNYYNFSENYLDLSYFEINWEENSIYLKLEDKRNGGDFSVIIWLEFKKADGKKYNFRVMIYDLDGYDCICGDGWKQVDQNCYQGTRVYKQGRFRRLRMVNSAGHLVQLLTFVHGKIENLSLRAQNEYWKVLSDEFPRYNEFPDFYIYREFFIKLFLKNKKYPRLTDKHLYALFEQEMEEILMLKKINEHRKELTGNIKVSFQKIEYEQNLMFLFPVEDLALRGFQRQLRLLRLMRQRTLFAQDTNLINKFIQVSPFEIDNLGYNIDKFFALIESHSDNIKDDRTPGFQKLVLGILTAWPAQTKGFHTFFEKIIGMAGKNVTFSKSLLAVLKEKLGISDDVLKKDIFLCILILAEHSSLPIRSEAELILYKSGVNQEYFGDNRKINDLTQASFQMGHYLNNFIRPKILEALNNKDDSSLELLKNEVLGLVRQNNDVAKYESMRLLHLFPTDDSIKEVAKAYVNYSNDDIRYLAWSLVKEKFNNHEAMELVKAQKGIDESEQISTLLLTIKLAKRTDHDLPYFLQLLQNPDGIGLKRKQVLNALTEISLTPLETGLIFGGVETIESDVLISLGKGIARDLVQAGGDSLSSKFKLLMVIFCDARIKSKGISSFILSWGEKVLPLLQKIKLNLNYIYELERKIEELPSFLVKALVHDLSTLKNSDFYFLYEIFIYNAQNKLRMVDYEIDLVRQLGSRESPESLAKMLQLLSFIKDEAAQNLALKHIRNWSSMLTRLLIGLSEEAWNILVGIQTVQSSEDRTTVELGNSQTILAQALLLFTHPSDKVREEVATFLRDARDPFTLRILREEILPQEVSLAVREALIETIQTLSHLVPAEMALREFKQKLDRRMPIIIDQGVEKIETLIEKSAIGFEIFKEKAGEWSMEFKNFVEDPLYIERAKKPWKKDY